MKSPSPPPAPDYAAQATAQGAANIETARAEGRMRNPNIVSPFGGQTVTWSGDQPTITAYSSPEVEKVNQGLLGTAGTGVENVQRVLSTPFSYEGFTPRLGQGDILGAKNQVVDALYGQSTRFLDPQFAQSERDIRTRLANQGFQEGTAGYEEAMSNEARRRTLAYADARDRAIAAGGAEESRLYGMSDTERQRQIAEAITGRQMPLNEVTALMSGSQIGVPQAGGYTSSNIAPPPLFGAAQEQYNAGLDVYNTRAGTTAQTNAALAGLAGAAALAFF